MKKPKCSQWKVWVGVEVEGRVFEDRRTLFFRSFNREAQEVIKNYVMEQTADGAKSQLDFWICKEISLDEMMVFFLLLKRLRKGRPFVCEVRLEQDIFMNPIRRAVSFRKAADRLGLTSEVFYKVGKSVKLDGTSFLSVGSPFSETHFWLEHGSCNEPSDYAKDVCLLR